MKQSHYKVTLTNGTVNHDYYKWAFSKEEVIILAQAEAIQEARGHKLVSCEKLD